MTTRSFDELGALLRAHLIREHPATVTRLIPRRRWRSRWAVRRAAWLAEGRRQDLGYPARHR